MLAEKNYGKGIIVPHLFNLGTRWKWMAIFTLWKFYSRKVLNKRLGVSDSMSPLFREELDLLHVLGQSPIMWHSLIINCYIRVPNLPRKGTVTEIVCYFSLIYTYILLFRAIRKKNISFITFFHIILFLFCIILYIDYVLYVSV